MSVSDELPLVMMIALKCTFETKIFETGRNVFFSNFNCGWISFSCQIVLLFTVIKY